MGMYGSFHGNQYKCQWIVILKVLRDVYFLWKKNTMVGCFYISLHIIIMRKNNSNNNNNNNNNGNARYQICLVIRLISSIVIKNIFSIIINMFWCHLIIYSFFFPNNKQITCFFFSYRKFHSAKNIFRIT